MIEPLTAAAIASIFFSEALKEGGKALGKGASDTFAQLVNAIRSKFQAHSLEGIMIQAQNQPTETNRATFESVLQSQIDGDSAFANQLQQLVEQLQSQDEQIRQVILSEIELSGDLKAQDITQQTTRDGSVEQEMLKGVKANNIDVGNLNQEA
jgi:hypothetical protein